MKFTAAVALFTASVQAGDWPLDKAPDNLPKGQCLVWPANEDGCNSQWAQFDDYCGQFWDEACEEVDEAWYMQDADWETPDWPADECFDLNMDTGCRADWELLMERCDNKGANGNTDGPYDWTIDCDVAYQLLGGLELWNAGDESSFTQDPVDNSNFPDSNAPEDMCFVWETSDDGTCRDQWRESDYMCEEGDYWTRDCANIAARWFSQDLEWVTPTRPEQECFSFEIEKDCQDQWMRLSEQCWNEADPETPYMWTNACEAAWMFSDAYTMWNADEEEMSWEEYCVSQGWEDCDEALVLKRKTNLKKMVSKQRPLGMRSHATSSHALWRKKSAVKATSATALLDKPAKKAQKKQQQANYSGYAYGAAAATFGICATVALAKRYQNKKLSDDYVRA